MITTPHIAMVALDGVWLSSAGTLLDSYAAIRGRVEQVLAQDSPATMSTRLSVVSLDGHPVEIGSGGLLPVDGGIADDKIYTLIWLPAFRAGSEEARVVQRFEALKPLCKWLRAQVAGGAIVGASGTAAMILIAARLTAHMAVPVAPALRPLVRSMFPRSAIDERSTVAEHGPLLISSGHAHDYELISRAFERAIAATSARWLRSIVGLPDNIQSLPGNDPVMRSARLWLDQRMAVKVSIRQMAAELSMSHSTLLRRFRKAFGMTPKAYVQSERIDAAKNMLAATNRSIESIGRQVGFSEPRLFRSAFRQITGMTPSSWRNTGPPQGGQA